MYPNFDDDSDEIDYGYSEQIDDDIDNESIDEDVEADSDSYELKPYSEEKWYKKEAWKIFMNDFKEAPIFRYYYDDGGGNSGYLYLLIGKFFWIDLYWEIEAGIDIYADEHWYPFVGQIKQRIDWILNNQTEYDDIQTFMLYDIISTDRMAFKILDQTYTEQNGDIHGCTDHSHCTHAKNSTTDINQHIYATLQDMFDYEWYPFYKKFPDHEPVIMYDTEELVDEEPVDEEPVDEEPTDEEPMDEDSYSETLWALEPGYYMSYYANLGFIIPNRYAIDVLIADKVSQYGFLPLVQVSLPLEINWIPEMAGLISTITAFTKGFLASQQEQIVSSAVISKPASSYIVTYYPSRTTHTLASAMESSGGNFSLTNFVKGRTGLNPMLYTAGTHIEDIIGKVARVFTTVWLLPMKDYVGFNREDSIREPNYDALPDMIYYIRNALRSEYLFSFNKIEVFDAEKVEKSNLSPVIDNIMVFDKWIKVRDSMNRYIDSLKVNAFGFGRIFDQMTRNWGVWSLQKGSNLTKHADFFARSGPYENLKIWGYMQKWAETHFIDESVSGYINTPYSVSDLILGR